MSFLSWHQLARRLSGWLLAALLLATLAPAISRVLAGGPAQDGQDWVELCTSQGMQWVRSIDLGTDAPTTQTRTDSSALDLCGHCTLASERFAPLLPVLPVVVGMGLAMAPPVSGDFTPVCVAALAPAARGPPLLN